MEIALEPPPDEDTATAVALAVAQAGLELEAAPAGYRSAWRRSAQAEAAHHSDPVTDAVADYALSPRSTRGASRA